MEEEESAHSFPPPLLIGFGIMSLSAQMDLASINEKKSLADLGGGRQRDEAKKERRIGRGGEEKDYSTSKCRA